MIERMTPMQVVQVHADCACGGELVPTNEEADFSALGLNWATPRTFVHACATCGAREELPAKYPIIRYIHRSIPVGVERRAASMEGVE